MWNNWNYGGTVTASSVIDWHGVPFGTSTPPDYGATSTTTLKAKVYYTCYSAMYSTAGVWDGVNIAQAGLIPDGYAPATYGGADFLEWSYTGAGGADSYLKFAITGLDPNDVNSCVGACPGGSCDIWAVHSAMPDLVKDGVVDDILDWVTPPSSGGGGSAYPAPSPPTYVVPTYNVQVVRAPAITTWGITRKMRVERKAKRFPKVDEKKASRYMRVPGSRAFKL